jgi:hypothetical protein
VLAIAEALIIHRTFDATMIDNVIAAAPLDLYCAAGKITFSCEINLAHTYRDESANRNPTDLGERFA